MLINNGLWFISSPYYLSLARSDKCCPMNIMIFRENNIHFILCCVVEVDWPSIYQYNSMHYTMLSICDCYCNCTMGLGKEIYSRAGSGHFFMVRVGFRACSFGTGWAQFTGNLHGLISGRNILNLGRIRAAFGPHSGHIWATFTSFDVPCLHFC